MLFSPRVNTTIKEKVAKKFDTSREGIVKLIENNELPAHLSMHIYDNLKRLLTKEQEDAKTNAMKYGREIKFINYDDLMFLERRVRNRIDVSEEERKAIIDLHILSEESLENLLQYETSSIVQDALVDYVKFLAESKHLSKRTKMVLNNLSSGKSDDNIAVAEISQSYKRKIISIDIIDESVMCNIISKSPNLQYDCLDSFKRIYEKNGKLSKGTINSLKPLLHSNDWICRYKTMETHSIPFKETVLLLEEETNPAVLKSGFDYLLNKSRDHQCFKEFTQETETNYIKLLQFIYEDKKLKKPRLFACINEVLKDRGELGTSTYKSNKHRYSSDKVKVNKNITRKTEVIKLKFRNGKTVNVPVDLTP
jgi:hypothetical protein